MRRFIIPIVCAALAGVLALAQSPEPAPAGQAALKMVQSVKWPTSQRASPVKLDGAKMLLIDGRDPSTWELRDGAGRPINWLVRRRPWGAPGKVGHGALVVANLRMGWMTDKAVMISTGSGDMGKAPDGRIPSYTEVLLENLDIGPLRNVSGIHMDHLWIGPGHDPAFRPNVTLRHVWLHDGDGGVMPVLFEHGGAKWGTITFDDVATTDCVHPATLKLATGAIEKVVVRNSPNLRLAIQGPAGLVVPVEVSASPGVQIAAPPDAQGQRCTLQIATDASGPSTRAVAQPATAPAANLIMLDGRRFRLVELKLGGASVRVLAEAD